MTKGLNTTFGKQKKEPHPYKYKFMFKGEEGKRRSNWEL